jgi:protein dithiol:quinone oxidoreductase
VSAAQRVNAAPTPIARLSTAQRFAALAVLCIAAVAAALLAQHGFDMQPCPWCILQRVVYVAIAIACGVAALVPARPIRIGLGAAALLLALAGAASAIWQHVVAAKSASCNLTLADRILNALGVETLLPSLFQVTANCADAAVRMLGVPFEYWSLALFTALALALAHTVGKCMAE